MVCDERLLKVKLSLISMGMKPLTKGFDFLSEAIVSYAKESRSLSRILHEMAEKYGISLSCLDRSMRICLSAASEESIIAELNRIAGYPYLRRGINFSCTNFIAVMGELIAYDEYTKNGNSGNTKEFFALAVPKTDIRINRENVSHGVSKRC